MMGAVNPLVLPQQVTLADADQEPNQPQPKPPKPPPFAHLDPPSIKFLTKLKPPWCRS